MAKEALLIVIGSLNRGGAEGHVAQVFSKINREKYSVVIYTTSHKGVLAPDLEKHGIKIVAPPCSIFLRKFGKLGRYFLYLCSWLRLCVLILQLRPAIVHCFLPGAYLMGGISVFVTRISKLAMSRRSLNYYQAKHPILASVERWLHKKTDLALGNSKAVTLQLIEEGFDKEKLALIYNGVDLKKFSRELTVARYNEFTMIIVANLFAYKGHSDLLHALSFIKTDLPKHWKLLCVGKDAGMGNELKKLTQQLGLYECVEWLGERADIIALLSHADLGILCSHEEGFSNSILESMAMGLPLVVTDVGGNSEAVIDGSNGLVVPPKNPKQLSRAILTLANNPERRNQMGIAARARAKLHFSLENCVNDYEIQYEKLLHETVHAERRVNE